MSPKLQYFQSHEKERYRFNEIQNKLIGDKYLFVPVVKIDSSYIHSNITGPYGHAFNPDAKLFFLDVPKFRYISMIHFSCINSTLEYTLYTRLRTDISPDDTTSNAVQSNVLLIILLCVGGIVGLFCLVCLCYQIKKKVTGKSKARFKRKIKYVELRNKNSS